MNVLREPITSLDDAKAAELNRKVELIKASRDISNDDALAMATRWQEQETSCINKLVYHYRVWYRRADTTSGHECVLVRTSEELYHWPAIYDYLAGHIRKTHDANCSTVATLAESSPDW